MKKKRRKNKLNTFILLLGGSLTLGGIAGSGVATYFYIKAKKEQSTNNTVPITIPTDPVIKLSGSTTLSNHNYSIVPTIENFNKKKFLVSDVVLSSLSELIEHKNLSKKENLEVVLNSFLDEDAKNYVMSLFHNTKDVEIDLSTNNSLPLNANRNLTFFKEKINRLNKNYYVYSKLQDKMDNIVLNNEEAFSKIGNTFIYDFAKKQKQNIPNVDVENFIETKYNTKYSSRNLPTYSLKFGTNVWDRYDNDNSPGSLISPGNELTSKQTVKKWREYKENLEKEKILAILNERKLTLEEIKEYLTSKLNWNTRKMYDKYNIYVDDGDNNTPILSNQKYTTHLPYLSTYNTDSMFYLSKLPYPSKEQQKHSSSVGDEPIPNYISGSTVDVVLDKNANFSDAKMSVSFTNANDDVQKRQLALTYSYGNSKVTNGQATELFSTDTEMYILSAKHVFSSILKEDDTFDEKYANQNLRFKIPFDNNSYVIPISKLSVFSVGKTSMDNLKTNENLDQIIVKLDISEVVGKNKLLASLRGYYNPMKLASDGNYLHNNLDSDDKGLISTRSFVENEYEADVKYLIDNPKTVLVSKNTTKLLSDDSSFITTPINNTYESLARPFGYTVENNTYNKSIFGTSPFKRAYYYEKRQLDIFSEAPNVITSLPSGFKYSSDVVLNKNSLALYSSPRAPFLDYKWNGQPLHKVNKTLITSKVGLNVQGNIHYYNYQHLRNEYNEVLRYGLGQVISSSMLTNLFNILNGTESEKDKQKIVKLLKGFSKPGHSGSGLIRVNYELANKVENNLSIFNTLKENRDNYKLANSSERTDIIAYDEQNYIVIGGIIKENASEDAFREDINGIPVSFFYALPISLTIINDYNKLLDTYLNN